MVFFKKKSRVQEEKPIVTGYIPEPVEPKVDSISDEQKAMEQARNVLDELVDKMKEMQLQTFRDEMLDSAQKNQALVDNNSKEFENARQDLKMKLKNMEPILRELGESVEIEESEEGKELDALKKAIKNLELQLKDQNKMKQLEELKDAINRLESSMQSVEKLEKMHDRLYILPRDLNDYKKRIDLIEQIYERNYTAADARSTGADQIDPLLLYYVNEFKEALQDGQKLKADACWKVFKYAVLVAHHRAPKGQTEEERQKMLNQRKDTVEKTFKVIIDTVDKIYGDMYRLSVMQKAYADVLNKYAAIAQTLNEIPSEYDKIIDELGFSGAIEKYPAGHLIRTYVDKYILAACELSNVELRALYVERVEADIQKLNDDLDSLWVFADLRFDEQGENYNEAQVAEVMKAKTDELLKDIKTMYDWQLHAYKISTELSSRVAEAAANKEWATAADDSRQRIKERAALERANDEFLKLKAQEKAKRPVAQTETQEYIQEEQEQRQPIMNDMG